MQTCCTKAKQSQIPNRKITSASYQVNLCHYKVLLPNVGPSSRSVLEMMLSSQLLKSQPAPKPLVKALFQSTQVPAEANIGAFQKTHPRGTNQVSTDPPPCPTDRGHRGYCPPIRSIITHITTAQLVQREWEYLIPLKMDLNYTNTHTHTYIILVVLLSNTEWWVVCSFRAHQTRNEICTIYSEMDI